MHPRRNEIYRCLGEKARVEVDSCVVLLAVDDTLLLCSDGLWEMAPNEEIATIWLCLRLPQPIPPRRSFKRHWQAVVKTMSAPL